ncbi:MAG: hypothetical protein GX771_11330 [Halomonadaceae bacterium]|nr:hypothetical protein [Halomonadaceae bacterium]
MPSPDRIEVRSLSNGRYVAKGEVFSSLDECLNTLARRYPGHRKLSLKPADRATDAFWRHKLAEQANALV